MEPIKAVLMKQYLSILNLAQPSGLKKWTIFSKVLLGNWLNKPVCINFIIYFIVFWYWRYYDEYNGPLLESVLSVSILR